MKTVKIGFAMIICMLVSIAIVQFSENYAEASEIILPEEYYFVFNAQQKEAGTEYEMKVPEVLLNVTAGTWEPETTVEWVSSEPGVVSIEPTTIASNFVKLIRKGPGYSTITAVIKQGSNTYSLSCLVKVDLLLDYQKTGLITATTTKERILILDEIDQEKQIYLKYIDYTQDDAGTVTGAAITASAVDWESDNEGVVTVDEEGLVKAIGAGSATITIITNTMSSQDRAIDIKLKVVVKPKFSLTYDVGSTEVVVNSVDDVDLVNPARDVPSNFVIHSNATLAQNLKWEVYDCSTGKKLSPTESSKLTYSVSPLSGNVSFSNVKAGTYEIFALADDKFTTSTNAPYAYMKFIVPIRITDTNIIMNVKDTYSIPDNSNIPFVDIFDYSIIGDQNVISLENGIITAKKEGTVTVQLNYVSGTNLYDGTTEIETIEMEIKVIDGISLSTTYANLYTSGSLQLNALITDYTVPIVWSSNNTSVATVEGGLVKAVGVGTAIITAKQTIKGVVKSATCQITVQQSVASITIDPSELTLPIDGYKTLHAKITPKNLSGVTLQWKSSDESIVSIVESDAMTATIQGVSGGHAVIEAINQDNVVVGYSHVNVQQPVTRIVLSETEVTLDLATKRLQLRATVYPENASNKEVKWSTTDSSKARVDQNGLITLLKPGEVSIIATSVDNAEVTAICNLNIEIPVVSIALDETTKIMYSGQTARLSYLVLPTNASNNLVTWTSTNTSVVTVDATGKVTAKGVGTAVIILKSLDGGLSTYCTITVKQVASGIKFDVSELALETEEYYYIKPTLSPANSTDIDLVWESSDTKVAVVDDYGKVTAREAGTAIIMARTEAGAVAYCNVTVTQAVKGLILNYSEKVVFIGEEYRLKVSVSPSEASNLDVTWKSSNPKIATVSDRGVVEGLVGGTTVITVTTEDGGFSATCVVTVRESMSEITLNYEEYKLGVKKSVTLIATVKTETATNKNVTWKSSNEKVAIVNKKGKVTGISKGYATITAIAQDGSEVEASCEIRVVTPVTGVTLDYSYLAMLVGESKTLNATIRPSNATYKNAKWTSSDESVAIVDEDGVVTAIKAGSATITAEAQDSSGKKAVCFVTIRDRLPANSITVMDKKLVMVSGEEKVVQVALNPVASTDDYTWSTDNSAVAKVDKNSGKITARATGTAYVTVMTDSGKTAVIEVTVVGLNITELTLEQYTNYVLFVEGATAPIRWDISNPEIAVVRNGQVSTRAIGTATITATVNGRRLTCKLTVTKIR